MMIGGRHLGGDPPVSLVVNLDERPVTTMVVRPGFFLDFVDVPGSALAGAGRYAKLTVSAQSTGRDAARRDRAVQPAVARSRCRPASTKGGRARIQSADGPVMALDERARRRQSASCRQERGDALRRRVAAPILRPGAADSSPGGRAASLSELAPTSDFTAEVPISADALAAANGRIVLTSDRGFVAGEREGTATNAGWQYGCYLLTVEGR